MKKNILIQYQGGGYDGCFWEWNFCIYDEDGKWQDIFSSGRRGLHSDKDTRAYIADVENRKDKEFYIINLASKQSWQEFLTETNAVLILGITKKLNKEHGYELPVMCSCCNELIPADDIYEMELVDWHGCGGIASTADNLICYDCQSNYKCAKCGEFIGKEKYEKETINGYCLYCYEQSIKDHVKESGYIYLEFDKINNRLFESEDFDTDFDRDNKYFYVNIKSVSGEKSYLIESTNEDTALEDVSWYHKTKIGEDIISTESGSITEIFENA